MGKECEKLKEQLMDGKMIMLGSVATLKYGGREMNEMNGQRLISFLV